MIRNESLPSHSTKHRSEAPFRHSDFQTAWEGSHALGGLASEVNSMINHQLLSGSLSSTNMAPDIGSLQEKTDLPGTLSQVPC